MKNVILFLSALILGTSGASATATDDGKVSKSLAYRYNDSFIFVENGITFSVYPDGEFDFYIDEQVTGRRNGVTFNSGYDYSPYTQYDDYGAVIQVENVPIYYDNYGRVSQIGDVDISYNRNRVQRVGGMYVYYNRGGLYDHHTGYINVYNRHYLFRPFHALFVRPALGLCLVYNRPYRRYYSPVRYTYYHPYDHNIRRSYAKIGRTHRYNKIRSERARIYRNDRRVAVRDNSVRSNVRSNRSIAQRNSSLRTDRSRSTDRSSATRSNNNGRSIAQRSNTPRGAERKTVARSTRTFKSPQRRSDAKRSTRPSSSRSSSNMSARNSSSRSVTQAPSRSSSVTRSSSSRSVSKAPSRSRSSSATRSSSSRSSVSRAPSRSSGNTARRTSTSRSSRRY